MVTLNEAIAEYSCLSIMRELEPLFPNNCFLINPPYLSAPNIAINYALKFLDNAKDELVAILVQSQVGWGKTKKTNVAILEKHTLVASVKMPPDLFLNKLPTHIFVFKPNRPHHNDDVVKFINFSDDGYKRNTRKRAKIHLINGGQGKQRYKELANLLQFGKSHLSIFTEKEYYEGEIDVSLGSDWNQTAPIDTRPTLADFRKTVRDYMSSQGCGSIQQIILDAFKYARDSPIELPNKKE